ncbi:MAG: hypothetical protein RR272_00410 [Synergistaceae bacterium]
MKNVFGMVSFITMMGMLVSTPAEASSSVELTSPAVIGGIVAVIVLTYLIKRFFER